MWKKIKAKQKKETIKSVIKSDYTNLKNTIKKLTKI